MGRIKFLPIMELLSKKEREKWHGKLQKKCR